MKIDRNILKKSATMLALIVSAAFMLEACAKEPLEGSGMITMTTTASKVGLALEAVEYFVVDWGDGKKSNAKDAFVDDITGYFHFTHDYSDATAHNIVITGGNVTKLYCGGNGLTALDVSRSTVLTWLYCSSNGLTALDVSRNTALTILNCGGNGLTDLDVSKNTMLLSLNCNHNQITRLDVSKNTALTLLYIVGNQLTASALNDLFRSLPDNTKTNDERTISIASSFSGNPGNLECDQNIARKKGWGFIVNIRE